MDATSSILSLKEEITAEEVKGLEMAILMSFTVSKMQIPIRATVVHSRLLHQIRNRTQMRTTLASKLTKTLILSKQ